MRMRRAGAALLLLLLLSGCGEPSTHSSEGADTLSVAARFRTEDGEALPGGAAEFSAGEGGGRCALDGGGEASVSGLPRSGEMLLTLFDQRQEVRGAMTLSLSEGAVIDATTGEDGVGHITIRRDTSEVALLFVLTEDGALRCTLWLSAEPQ